MTQRRETRFGVTMGMDLQTLKMSLFEWEQQKRVSNGAYWQTHGEAWRKVHQGIYTEEDVDSELESLHQQANAIDSVVQPLLLDCISAYLVGTPDDRASFRDMFATLPCAAHALLDFILNCASRLETPDDDEIFHLALAAASIENCGHDFRDTSAVLAEIAVAAVKAGIKIERHCTAVAELSSDEQ